MLMAMDVEIQLRTLTVETVVETTLAITLATTPVMIQMEMESLTHSIVVQTEPRIGVQHHIPIMILMDAEMPRKTQMTIMTVYWIQTTGAHLEV